MEVLLETRMRVSPPRRSSRRRCSSILRPICFGLNEARARQDRLYRRYRHHDLRSNSKNGRGASRARLRTLGVHPEERVLLVMLDTVELPIAFLGALYAGVVPVVANTLLTAADYVYMLTHSHARAVIASGPLLPNVTQAMATAEHDGCQLIVSQPPEKLKPFDWRRVLERSDRRRHARPSKRSYDRLRRHRVLAVFVGLDRQAERHGPHARESVLDRRVVCEADSWHCRKRRGVLRGQTVLRVRSRQRLTFPLSVGATAVLMAERPTADAIFTRLVRHRPTVFYGVPTLYASMLVSPDAARARRCSDARLHVGRRSAAARNRRALHRALRLRDSRRHRLDRNAAYLPVESRG